MQRHEASRPHASTSARKGSEEDREDGKGKAAARKDAVSTAANKGKDDTTIAWAPKPVFSRSARVLKERGRLTVRRTGNPLLDPKTIGKMVPSTVPGPPPGGDASDEGEGADDSSDEDGEDSSDEDLSSKEQSPEIVPARSPHAEVSLLGVRTFVS